MPKLEQLLIIDPPTELKFVGPFTNVVTTELCLKNPTDKDIMYKVRTTAPMRYCVRPNCGVLPPHEQVVISLSLQPLKHDLCEKTVDKFMVMSMIAPRGSTDTMEDIWKNANSGQISDTKLRCTFIMPPAVEKDNTLPQTVNAINPICGDNSLQRQKKHENDVSDDGRSNVIPEFLTELEKLKEEHKKLLDEGMKLRNVSYFEQKKGSCILATSKAGGSVKGIFGALPPLFYLAVMFLVGLIIGKFVM